LGICAGELRGQGGWACVAGFDGEFAVYVDTVAQELGSVTVLQMYENLLEHDCAYPL
jgi:hypothetical protein